MMLMNKRQIKSKKKKWYLAYLKSWQLYLLLLPTILYFVIFRYVPILWIQVAFKDYMPLKGLLGSDWTTPFFKHFTRFFQGYYAKRLIVNTLSLSFGQLLFGFPIPVILALLLNEMRSQKFKKAAQTITYAPHFISTVILVGLLNTLLNTNNGLVNHLLLSAGLIKEPIQFLTSAGWFKPLYIISGIWQEMGWGAVVYMAALAGVDQDLYEAAKVDGAGRMKRILYITIPSILPTMITMLILNCGKVMNIGYEKVYLMQNDLNIASSDVISTYVYKVGILNSQYSFSTAVNLFNSVINTALIVIVNKISKRLTDNGLW